MSSVPRLYYTAGSCGMASFIAAHVAGLKIDSEQVDLASHKTTSGADFYAINPKGNVPTLVLPGGVTLNEGAAVLQYIADQAPESGLAPKWGTVERYQLINQLNYVSSEVHASFAPLANKALSAEAKSHAVTKLYTKFDYLEHHVLRPGQPFIVGDRFTIVDSYLYICLTWCGWVGVTIDKHPKLKAYFEGIKSLKPVQEAHDLANKIKAAAH